MPVLVALALIGCGAGDDREQARATVERFLAALAREDGAAACAELAGEVRAALEDQEGVPCRSAVGALAFAPARVTRVEVVVTSAKVDLAGGASVFLDRGAGGWRLSAVGCRPDGPPADHPFACELDA